MKNTEIPNTNITANIEYIDSRRLPIFERARIPAPKIKLPNFANSDGWITKPAIFIHRVAPNLRIPNGVKIINNNNKLAKYK